MFRGNQSNQRNAQSVVRKNLRFPGTNHEIEESTFKNDDGGIRRIEVLFKPITTAYDEIKEEILPKLGNERTDLFNLVIDLDGKGVRITKIPKTGEVTNYDQEVTHYVLKLDEMTSLRNKVITSIGTLLALFEKYFADANGKTISQLDYNQPMMVLLRLTNGGKIRYLEDIMNWYLALGGQTYFNTIASVVMSGAYTFSSILSIGALIINKPDGKGLRGKYLLMNAYKRKEIDERARIQKGEIFLASGLTLIYLRQVRIKMPTISYISKVLPTDYVSVDLVEDDVLMRETPFKVIKTGSAAVASPSVRNRLRSPIIPIKPHYYKIEHRLKVREILEKLISLGNNSEVKDMIDARAKNSPTLILDILQVCALSEFDDFTKDLDNYGNNTYITPTLNEICKIDEFQMSEVRDSIQRYLPRILMLVDATYDPNDPSNLVEEFKRTSDIHEQLEDLIESLITQISQS